ncbi:MAG: ribonuclease [Halanaerobiales bacterium]|nr:ribonuclease [Halanaerobiales bacterium]
MADKEKVSVISLGGRGEVGKNMIIIEDEEDIIILDAGILFPDDDKYGVELIIPDISYLLERREKIRGIIFSHGHEDHIGAIPYLLELLNPPLYGTDLTMGLIENRLKDTGLLDKADLNVIGSSKNARGLKLGSFTIEFCHVNHSIPASVAMGIHTPAGLIVYTGDYKFDQTPINNPQTDYQKLADWGKKGVLALLGDSTNSEREGHTLSERVVAQNLEDSFRLIKERIIIATFSSNIDRIQQIINAGYKSSRQLAVSGYSMANTIKIASQLGYIDIPKGMLITLDEAKNLDPGKVILLMTGSQGEYEASLTRMARGEHRNISIIPGDTVYLSSSPIPGNERAIGETINLLYSRGARVIYDGMLDLHASGHACQEEIKMMINLTRPKFLIPVHGEFRHLYHHAQLGRHVGVPVQNIFIAENGDRLELTADSAKITEKIKAGEIYIEGNQISDTGEIVLNDRKRLAQNGFVNIIIPVNREGEFLGSPTIISRGFVYNKESENFLEQARRKVARTLQEISKKRISDWSLVKKKIIDVLNEYFYKQANRTPLILPVIIEIKD